MRTIDQNHYVDQAEQVIRTLQSRTRERRDGTSVPVPMVTTSKIRNLLAMTSDIYNETLGLPQGPLPERLRSRIEYLRVRFIYEAGKDPEGRVRDFVTGGEDSGHSEGNPGRQGQFPAVCPLYGGAGGLPQILRRPGLKGGKVHVRENSDYRKTGTADGHAHRRFRRLRGPSGL